MKRREFIGIAGVVATFGPVQAAAQSAVRLKRIAYLSAGNSDAETDLETFQSAMERLGWNIGKTIHLEYRISDADLKKAREFASQLVSSLPDVCVATNTQMVQFLQNETKTIPIVFVRVPDPVASGLVESLARPGGNVTGFTNFDPSMGEKWLELLKQIAPNTTDVLVVLQSNNPTQAGYLKSVQEAASRHAVEVKSININDVSAFRQKLDEFSIETKRGLLVAPSAFASVFKEEMIMEADRHHLPAVYPYSDYVISGGLLSYGIDRRDDLKRAAIYVDRLLNGIKPTDLPVQNPTKFVLSINFKTAKSLGLDIPQSIVVAADEVIE